MSVLTTLINAPTNGGILLNFNGTFAYRPNDDFVGQDTFTYQICNSRNLTLCDTAQVVLQIGFNSRGEATNGRPYAQDDAASGLKNASISGNLTGNDFDVFGKALTYNTMPLVAIVTEPFLGALLIGGIVL